MVQILGLVGSPRKGKNTDTLVQSALNGAKSAGAKITKVYLNDLKIKPCQACANHPYPKYCVYQDGMTKLYRLFETVDGIVLGTPAYYQTISSQTKLMIDRCNCLSKIIKSRSGKLKFYRRIKKPKVGIFIWVADCSTNVKPALASIKYWSSDINLKILKTITLIHSERKNNQKRKSIGLAFNAGIDLVNKINKLQKDLSTNQ